MQSTPPALPGTSKRFLFETKSLWWLVFFDAAWGVEEIVTNIASVLLMPVCFVGTALPVFFIQKKAGDRTPAAMLKAALFGLLAALPFPVTGTLFGASMLAWAKSRTDK